MEHMVRPENTPRQGHLSPIELLKCMYNIVPDLAIHKIHVGQFLWNLKDLQSFAQSFSQRK